MSCHRLAVGIGAPGVPSELHPYGQIHALHKGRIGPIQVRLSLPYLLGKVLFFRHRGIVYVRAERLLDSIDVRAIPIGRNLRSVRHPLAHILEQGLGILRRPFPQQVANHHLAQWIDGKPEIAIPLLRGVMILDAVLLLLDEAPSLIDLGNRRPERFSDAGQWDLRQ